MVGLAAVAEFTHGIEAVLERIRSRSLGVDSDIITTLLEARDHLAMMVEAEAVRSPIPPSGELTQRLAMLWRGAGFGGVSRRGKPWSRSRAGGPAHFARAEADSRHQPGGESPGSQAQAETGAAQDEEDGGSLRAGGFRRELHPAPGDGELTVYQITLMPGPDVLRRGVNPLGVLDELRELGETTIATDPDLVPPLEQLDPERCYLTWTIQVKTGVSPDRLSEAFLFFAEDSALEISRLTPDGKLVPLRSEAPPPAEAVSTPPIGFEKPPSSAAAAAAIHPHYRRPRASGPAGAFPRRPSRPRRSCRA